MHILMVAWGSRGDVVPFVALGRGLADAGHQVTIAAADGFGELVTSAGLAYRPFAISLDSDTTDPVVRRWLAGSTNLRTELRNMRSAAERFAPVFAGGLAAMVEDADAYVGGMFSIGALAPWAARRGRPVVNAMLQPMLPTATGAALTHPAVAGGDSALNRLAGWWQTAGMYSLFRTPIQTARRALGLPPGGLGDYLGSVTRTPTVVGVSPLVVPRPTDWPAHAQVTGYWPAPAPAEYRPPAELAEFLDAGEPPIQVGFGSMPSLDPDGLRRLVLDGVARSGRRVILGGSLHDSAEPVRPLAAGVISAGAVPYEWLFPRTAGVVCHGGAGTTGIALRAGVPVGVVSHMGDQHYWGRRVHELGVGPAPVHRARLDSDRLAELIMGLADPGARERADRLGAALRAEDGVTRAVTFIQEVFG